MQIVRKSIFSYLVLTFLSDHLLPAANNLKGTHPGPQRHLLQTQAGHLRSIQLFCSEGWYWFCKGSSFFRNKEENDIFGIFFSHATYIAASTDDFSST